MVCVLVFSAASAASLMLSAFSSARRRLTSVTKNIRLGGSPVFLFNFWMDSSRSSSRAPVSTVSGTSSRSVLPSSTRSAATSSASSISGSCSASRTFSVFRPNTCLTTQKPSTCWDWMLVMRVMARFHIMHSSFSLVVNTGRNMFSSSFSSSCWWQTTFLATSCMTSTAPLILPSDIRLGTTSMRKSACSWSFFRTDIYTLWSSLPSRIVWRKRSMIDLPEWSRDVMFVDKMLSKFWPMMSGSLYCSMRSIQLLMRSMVSLLSTMIVPMGLLPMTASSSTMRLLSVLTDSIRRCCSRCTRSARSSDPSWWFAKSVRTERRPRAHDIW
mmetsp:Transcript_28504/g.47868  ORF Transcript_28504/g.47868 Transcript_28504/m.47868 type:complete len:327 (+) Transcript_28504:1237-2217(+)